MKSALPKCTLRKRSEASVTKTKDGAPLFSGMKVWISWNGVPTEYEVWAVGRDSCYLVVNESECEFSHELTEHLFSTPEAAAAGGGSGGQE